MVKPPLFASEAISMCLSLQSSSAKVWDNSQSTIDYVDNEKMSNFNAGNEYSLSIG
jgi:hypothetical protein